RADWSYKMNSRLINGPYVFNQSDSSNFIFLQEQDHTVHSLSTSGKKLWSSLFSGRIIGNVKQLEDGSLLLVTDRQRLYRFGADGQAYPGFSLSLPHSASK